jgi:alpha-D-ribose 1-methylphosphonate 5-triphosphate synthase subunit PhnI
VYATLEDTPALAAARRLAEGDAPTSGGVGWMPALEEQVCAEAGLWAPDAARQALAQARGDLPRAVALVRVWAAALPQLAVEVVSPGDVQILRRLSAAYAQVPGGQWLGASPDLASRLLEWDDDDTTPHEAPVVVGSNGDHATTPTTPPTRAGCTRVRELLHDVPVLSAEGEGDGADPASTTLRSPLDRPTRLGVLSRGDTAALVTLASLVLGRRREAVLAELTAGVVALRLPHPRTGRPCVVAEVPVSEAEAVLDAEVDGRPGFALGWGASLGTLERRVVALALLDGAMQADAARGSDADPEGGEGAASQCADDSTAYFLDEQTVLAAVDGSATNGFVEHLRLPHYASFASALDQARESDGGAAR